MLSYQHEYHAGNVADIQKHVCLNTILEGLCSKEKPFTVIDSHSGAGVFNLQDQRSLKTGEAQEGILKLYKYFTNPNIPFPPELKNYMQKEDPYIKEGLYAGSPEIERLNMRKGDNLFLIEKHPQAIENLQSNLHESLLTPSGRSKSLVKVNLIKSDSYQSLNALTPPLIKRGLVLVDPSYEDSSDYKEVTDAIKNVHKKWNTAIIALWYPLVSRRKNETSQMLSALEDDAKMSLNPSETFRCEMIIKDAEEVKKEDGPHLYGSGMFVINPPWNLKEKMEKNCSFIRKMLIMDNL